VTRAVAALPRRAVPSHSRPVAESTRAQFTAPEQVTSHALNVLCLWFVSQLFFNEKTTFLTFSWIANIRPDRLIIVYLASYVLLWGRHRHLAHLKMVKEEIMMISFFGIILVSCLLSGVRPLNPQLSSVFSFIGFPMFTFWLCRRIPFSVSNVRRLISVMIAIGGYLGLCGVCEHYGWRLFIFPDYIFDPSIGIHFGRSRGPFVQAHIFGGVLCVIALMTAWFMKHIRATVAAVMVLGLMVASIYLSDTRAAWLFFALSVLILGVVRNGVRPYALTAVLAVAAIFVSGALSHFSLYEVTLFKRRDEAAQSRVVLAGASVAMLKERPLLGSGYGTFVSLGDLLEDEGQRKLVEAQGNHNTVLGLAVEVGLVGTLPYVLILAGFLWRADRFWRLSKKRSPPARDFAVAALAALIGYLCLMQFGDVRGATLFNCFIFSIYGFVFAWADHLKNTSPQQPTAALVNAPNGPRTVTRTNWRMPARSGPLTNNVMAPRNW
jgi:O-antigen ligase/polysaccharide polymerase Wzy-like membrane protein